MKNPITKIFIETIESINALTYWYMSLLKNTDCNKQFTIEGKKLNTLYWLTAHIANSEDLLLLKAFYSYS